MFHEIKDALDRFGAWLDYRTCRISRQLSKRRSGTRVSARVFAVTTVRYSARCRPPIAGENTPRTAESQRMILLDTIVSSEIMRAAPAETALEWLNQQESSTLYLSTITISKSCAASWSGSAGATPASDWIWMNWPNSTIDARLRTTEWCSTFSSH